MRIAVLDDDRSQSDLVCQVLTSAGHTCHAFASGKDMLNQLRRESYDMLLIHWQAPNLSGAEVIRWARERLPANLPVLFMTSRSSEDDIIAGLAAGADDYVVEQIQFGQYIFETRTGRLTMNGKPIELTQKEFDLALLFFRNIGRPLSRAYILEAVWARDVEIPSRTMDTHVSRVRSKLQLRPEHGFRLAPVYSYGYRLEQMSQ